MRSAHIAGGTVRRIVMLISVALAVAGCSSAGHGKAETSAPISCFGEGCGGAAASSIAAAEGSASAAPTEGPAAEAHAWADGITAKVTSITRAPANLGFSSPTPGLDAVLLVTVEFSNAGSAPLAWDTSTATPDWKLYYGANRYEADGYSYDRAPKLPSRLMPGTTATWTTLDFLPSDQLGTLALRVTPLWNDPAHQPWTFTGVDSLLR